MNREIKFRGINRINGEIVYGLPAFTSGGAIGLICGWMGEDGGEQYCEIEVFEVSQFTGIKDKNGKEIYEGDILKDSELIGKVVYASPSFIVETSNEIYALAKGLVMQADLKDSEVIGNIYQNPELLK